jgi:uncharacterized membrane protein YphA (DoxX/SURF4 family)
MERVRELYNDVDQIIVRWMARHGIRLLRLSLGIIFLWFGALKFFPELSPAEDLATRTINQLTFGLISEDIALLILATWECLIGIGLLFRLYLRATLLLLFVQMVGTIMPIFLFPSEVFTQFPYGLTLEGQYIFKNAILISAGLVIGATVRGGDVVADPQVAAQDTSNVGA